MKKEKKNNAFTKAINILIFITLTTITYMGYVLFFPNIFPTKESKYYLCIPDNSNINKTFELLSTNTTIGSMLTLKQTATLLRYNKVRTGRYEIYSGMNNFQLIRMLRSGRQTPVKLTFNNVRTKSQLAGKLSHQLMADSSSIIALLNDTNYLAGFDLNTDNAISQFIPNTYEVFWNLTAKEIFERMHKEHDKFWTSERKEKAAAIPLSIIEVSTLASIVEEETNSKKDRLMVAGLYINRLKKDMPLQADPTVKFAIGDFSLKRILFGHLRTNSPYNTYRKKGLPPGPIRVSSPNAIDAVLNYKHHDYIFMCASATLNGEHKFASSWEEHSKNAKEYQNTLNKLNIK